MIFFTLVAGLSLLQAAPPALPNVLLDEVKQLSAATDNDARFEVLTALLKVHNLTFAIEPVVLDKIGARDTRSRGRNVVVTFGDGPDELVVGAHYDAVKLPDGSFSRGAVDNGASSVILIHVAEALRGQSLPTRVKFVWFDFEESGLLGSAKYLEAHPSDRIRAMLNYDINGYGDTALFGPPMGGDDPRLTRMMLETCAAETVECLYSAGMPPGDDRSFGKAKIPTLSIGMLPALEAHQIWLELNGGTSSGLEKGFQPLILRTIHTAADTPERVDGAAMARAHRLAVALVRRVATALP